MIMDKFGVIHKKEAWSLYRNRICISMFHSTWTELIRVQFMYCEQAFTLPLYCYRRRDRRSVVSARVCWEPCWALQNGWINQDAVYEADWRGPKTMYNKGCTFTYRGKYDEIICAVDAMRAVNTVSVAS